MQILKLLLSSIFNVMQSQNLNQELHRKKFQYIHENSVNIIFSFITEQRLTLKQITKM